MKFNEFGLSKPIENAIEKAGYTEATPIQKLAIPKILENKDMIGIAQTGTGKTAAFALPILEKLVQNYDADRRIKVLILSPTRELALQIKDNIRDYASETKFKCSVILGGVNQRSQIDVLKKGVDILVATPGRLLDLTKRKFAKLDNVDMLVLDEADTMLDMGFIHDVKDIVGRLPKERQTLLFSATMPKAVKELAKEFLKDPETIRVPSEKSQMPKIKQLVYFVDKGNKFKLLLDILVDEKIKSALIFTRTKYGANKLAEQLREYDIKISVIHGNKTQKDRVKALDNFKQGKTNILVATDIAARGIDINDLSHVINYDMPEQDELYVHRIGRTARAGKEGVSISLCNMDERKRLLDIERLLGYELEVIEDHKYPMNILVNNDTNGKPTNKNNYGKKRYSNNRSFKKSDSKGNVKKDYKSEDSKKQSKNNYSSYNKNSNKNTKRENYSNKNRRK